MNYLDNIAQNFTTLKGMDYYTNEYEYNTLKKYFIGDTALELGCADGAMTKLLVDEFKSITVIDGSNIAIERLNGYIKSDKLQTIVSYFEDVELDLKFDVIFMGHILEHVDDPLFILDKFKNNLKKDGRIMITVPNAKSIHRLAAVKMGILESIYTLNDTDLKCGHKRVYDFEKLCNHIYGAGLILEKRDGYMLKFLSNKQIEESWDDALIRTYMEMGSDFLENAAEIVAICKCI